MRDGFGVQPIDDCAWRCRGRHQAVPGRVVESGDAGFVQRGHIRQQTHPLDRRHPERAQPAGFHVRQRWSQGRHVHGDLVTHQRGQCRPTPLVGYVNHAAVHGYQQQLGRQMDARADAGRTEAQLAGIGPHLGDQLLEVSRRQRRLDQQDIGLLGDQGHRSEIAKRVVGQFLVERWIDGQADAAQQHRIAVGRRLRDDVRAQHTPCTGAVVRHDGGAQYRREAFRENPRDDIGPTSAREWHDHADRAIGITALRECRQRHRCKRPDRD